MLFNLRFLVLKNLSIRFKMPFLIVDEIDFFFQNRKLVLVVTGILLQQFFSSIYIISFSVTNLAKNGKSASHPHMPLTTQNAHILIYQSLLVISVTCRPSLFHQTGLLLARGLWWVIARHLAYYPQSPSLLILL